MDKKEVLKEMNELLESKEAKEWSAYSFAIIPHLKAIAIGIKYLVEKK